LNWRSSETDDMFRDILEKRHKTIKENCRRKKENHKLESRYGKWKNGQKNLNQCTPAFICP
jgi:hypothetical protein